MYLFYPNDTLQIGHTSRLADVCKSESVERSKATASDAFAGLFSARGGYWVDAQKSRTFYSSLRKKSIKIWRSIVFASFTSGKRSMVGVADKRVAFLWLMWILLLGLHDGFHFRGWEEARRWWYTFFFSSIQKRGFRTFLQKKLQLWSWIAVLFTGFSTRSTKCRIWSVGGRRLVCSIRFYHRRIVTFEQKANHLARAVEYSRTVCSKVKMTFSLLICALTLLWEKGLWECESLKRVPKTLSSQKLMHSLGFAACDLHSKVSSCRIWVLCRFKGD